MHRSDITGADTFMADSAIASALESKTAKVGMTTDEVKKTLGNPAKIVDLGAGLHLLIYESCLCE